LKIAVNANYRKYLWYPVLQINAEDSSYYDSIQKLIISKYDSLRNGKITVSIFSLLTTDFERKIDLQKDTTIYFDTTLYSSFKNTKNIKEFRTLTSNNLDTIYIGQKVVGCFGSSIEKIKIYKQVSKYNVVYCDYRSENQNLVISDSLFSKVYLMFLNESQKLFPDKVGGLTFEHMSTTRIDTYIRQGNNILEFPDVYNWGGYYNFKKGIGIMTKE